MRLAIVTSHPIQYNAPWFRYLQEESRKQKAESSPFSVLPSPLCLRVFYLWDGAGQMDRGFGVSVKWDIPLLEGYEYEFVENTARKAGPGTVTGLRNPTLASRVGAFNPDAVLVFGYNYISHYRFLLSGIAKRIPLLFRGDSHLLGREEKVEGRKGTLKALCRSPFSILRSPLSVLVRRAVFRRFSAFLHVGQANKDYFRYHGVSDEKLFFAPHAIDNDRFMLQAPSSKLQALAWKKELGIPSDHKVILFAGKFEPKKRPNDLISAFLAATQVSQSSVALCSSASDIRSPISDLRPWSLLLVGSGALEPELRKQAANCGNIVFAPFQNQTQMPRTYAAADLFVLPSFGPGETWGLAVNEAMCMGKPIIVSNHVGCARDLVQSGQNGLIFPAGDVPALADALRLALSDPERLRAWGQRSLEIIQNYSYKQATQGLLNALEFVRSGQ